MTDTSLAGKPHKSPVRVFALIDCNNFFVSCERLFRPDLKGRPVVVLSSNDGCVVARSDEAKALGIPMAAPAFKFRSVFEKHKVIQFSANFELYGNISRRITELLATITPRIEIYSVDESFLDLSELPIEDYGAWGREVCAYIMRWIGVPVSIGIATSKTLAKLAGDRAKKVPILEGACSFVGPGAEEIQAHLAAVPISNVWGIGWRLAPRIRAEGINNALHMSKLRPQRAVQLMGIHGRQLVAELNGTSCYPLEREGKVRKSIARTRTFGHDTSDRSAIEAALATFATQAAFRLRISGQRTRRISLFLTTSKHKPGYRRWEQEKILLVPTADTGTLISSVMDMLRSLYLPRMEYHRAGVMLYDFVPGSALQTDLLGEVSVADYDRSVSRMSALDAINERYGRQTIKYATEELGKAWEPRYNLRSPRYVSHWGELPVIRS